MRRTALLALALLTSCDGTLVDTYDACSISATLSVTAARPGDTVTLVGAPLTTTWDTLVQLDGVAAEVTDVARAGDSCSDCLDCRSEAVDCAECDDTCADCVETVTFVVPERPAGPTTVILTNAYGSTAALPFEILAETGTTGETADTGLLPDTADTGPLPDTADTGPLPDTADTGLPADTGDTAATSDTAAPTDTGAPADTGIADTADTGAPADTGIADTGAPTDTADTAIPADTGATVDTGPPGP